ncbi:unnamed protein product [Prorocentrum cordatum]|uniref:Uncharacterized protein n=1 Tax=Prorocentrum cordatum TaxID=2364126 RepID=A0ABN9WPS0_9DINO|nr:unnamed protein product [Polarella glacialis]
MNFEADGIRVTQGAAELQMNADIAAEMDHLDAIEVLDDDIQRTAAAAEAAPATPTSSPTSSTPPTSIPSGPDLSAQLIASRLRSSRSPCNLAEKRTWASADAQHARGAIAKISRDAVKCETDLPKSLLARRELGPAAVETLHAHREAADNFLLTQRSNILSLDVASFAEKSEPKVWERLLGQAATNIMDLRRSPIMSDRWAALVKSPRIAPRPFESTHPGRNCPRHLRMGLAVFKPPFIGSQSIPKILEHVLSLAQIAAATVATVDMLAKDLPRFYAIIRGPTLGQIVRRPPQRSRVNGPAVLHRVWPLCSQMAAPSDTRAPAHPEASSEVRAEALDGRALIDPGTAAAKLKWAPSQHGGRAAAAPSMAPSAPAATKTRSTPPAGARRDGHFMLDISVVRWNAQARFASDLARHQARANCVNELMSQADARMLTETHGANAGNGAAVTEADLFGVGGPHWDSMTTLPALRAHVRNRHSGRRAAMEHRAMLAETPGATPIRRLLVFKATMTEVAFRLDADAGRPPAATDLDDRLGVKMKFARAVEQGGQVLTEPGAMAKEPRRHWAQVFAPRGVDEQLLKGWLLEDEAHGPAADALQILRRLAELPENQHRVERCQASVEDCCIFHLCAASTALTAAELAARLGGPSLTASGPAADEKKDWQARAARVLCAAARTHNAWRHGQLCADAPDAFRGYARAAAFGQSKLQHLIQTTAKRLRGVAAKRQATGKEPGSWRPALAAPVPGMLEGMDASFIRGLPDNGEAVFHDGPERFEDFVGCLRQAVAEHAEGGARFRSLDVSRVVLPPEAVECLFAALAEHAVHVDVLKMFKVGVDDNGLRVAAGWLAALSPEKLPSQLHLSHNRIGAESFAELVGLLEEQRALLEEPARPIWTRVEGNPGLGDDFVQGLVETAAERRTPPRPRRWRWPGTPASASPPSTAARPPTARTPPPRPPSELQQCGRRRQGSNGRRRTRAPPCPQRRGRVRCSRRGRGRARRNGSLRRRACGLSSSGHRSCDRRVGCCSQGGPGRRRCRRGWWRPGDPSRPRGRRRQWQRDPGSRRGHRRQRRRGPGRRRSRRRQRQRGPGRRRSPRMRPRRFLPCRGGQAAAAPGRPRSGPRRG